MSFLLLAATMTSPIVQMAVTSENPMKGLKWTHFTIADPLPGSSWATGGIPLADFEGDGDLDIISKIWNKDGATYHADFWRNDTPRRTSDAPK